MLSDCGPIFFFFFFFFNFLILRTGVMGYGAAEETGLGCFVVINPRVLSANSVDFGLFLFHQFSKFTPPPHPINSFSEPIQTPPQGVPITRINHMQQVGIVGGGKDGKVSIVTVDM